MGFSHGSATAGTLIGALSAWLLASAGQQPEELWPYLLFGAIFVILLAHLIQLVLGAELRIAGALLHGIPLGLAAYWLGSTPYRWLEYTCWAYAAAYIILVPRMMRAISRSDRRMLFRRRDEQRGFTLQEVGLALLIVIAVAGLIMGTALVARVWGFYAGVGALVLLVVGILVLNFGMIYIRALFSGAKVTFTELIALRLRAGRVGGGRAHHGGEVGSAADD